MAAAHEALDLGKVKYTALYALVIYVSLYLYMYACMRVFVIDNCLQ